MFYLLVSISLWWTAPIQPPPPPKGELLTASNAVSKVEWISPTEHDFGVLQHHKPSTHEFRFRNTSGEALTVDNVRTSCGCTVPDWSYEPVAPDSVGIISVEYDARDIGYFYKKLKVYLRGQRKPELLVIEGEVE